MTSRILRPPSGDIDAVITVPGSKSVANRALICAMLADGTSTINGVPDGDDTTVILDVLQQVHRLQRISHSAVVVDGNPNGRIPNIVDALLAGTSSRFLTAVAALNHTTTIIDGGEPLRMRPMSELHEALMELGADITPLGEIGHLPVAVSRGKFDGGKVSVRGDVSSQFISALMLIGPVLSKGITVDIRGELVSRSYVEMTASVMRTFGAIVDISESSIDVSAGGYRACDYTVEPDYSSAAFPIVALLLRPGKVRINNLALSSMQGDSEILTIIQSMGLFVTVEGSDVVIEHRAGITLKPISLDMGNCSDLVPAVAVGCLAVSGESVITGVGFIRKKESDRLGDLASELSHGGAVVRVDEDGLTISGGRKIHSAKYGTHHDHRLAMAFSLLSLMTGECEVEDAHVVSKSWPQFFIDMEPILGSSSPAN